MGQGECLASVTLEKNIASIDKERSVLRPVVEKVSSGLSFAVILHEDGIILVIKNY